LFTNLKVLPILDGESVGVESPDDNYLILDSDCIFIKPVDLLFKEAAPSGFISFEDAAQPRWSSMV
jgi:hypothetical protein